MGNEMRTHRIGIVTGSGPEAGIDMWGKVLEEHRALLGDAYRGDIDAPEVVVISLPELGYSMDLENEEERVWAALRNAAERIAEQVDVYVIACNTLNYYADRLRALGLPALLITPAETVLDELASRGSKNVALLGSRQTMDLEGWSSYSSLTEQVAVELPKDTAQLHELIVQVKLAGGSTPEVERGFEKLRASLKSDTVLLACTELPLLRGPAALPESGAIDVSRLLARAAVRWTPAVVGTDAGSTAKTPSDRPVAVLYTGGTFGMVPSPNGLVPNPQLGTEVENLVTDREASGAASVPWTYAATEIPIDSAEVDMPTLGNVADTLREIIARENPRAVVVIHGTDSMAYNSAHAAFALADLDVPIVFTGSQLPLGTPQNDAARNFRLAFDAASRGLAAGVWIAFDSRIMPAVRATKRSSESFYAFGASRPLAEGSVGVDATVAANLQDAVGREAPRVGLVKVSPGLTAAQLSAVLADCPTGVVLECYGLGTAPMLSGALAEPLREATARGTVVLAVTQCDHGNVELGRYAVGSALVDAGVLNGGDLTPEAALGKIVAFARAGFEGAELRELLAANLVGERSS